MNKENVLAVAAAIEGHTIPDLGFNMAQFSSNVSSFYPDQSGHDCGTVACIAGTAKALRTGKIPNGYRVNTDEEADWLGLGQRDAEELFFARNRIGSLESLTAAQAVKVLRHLADTGLVDWQVGP